MKTLGAVRRDVVLCGICGFPINDAGRCPRCLMATEEEAEAIRRAAAKKQAMGEIQERL